MLLAIDVGNTNVTVGIWDGHRWMRHWRLLTVRDKTTDEYGITLKSLLAEAALSDGIQAVVMSSVVPPLTPTFAALSETYLGRVALQVTSELDTGILIRTDSPEAVGADRIVNAVAAYHLFPGASITIDMGTATKFDVVTARAELLGGVIAPGMQLTADALASRAAKLSQVALEAPPATIGRNTIHAMQSGLVFGYVCLIEGMVQRIKAEHPDRGQPIRVLGTGGLIHLIAAQTSIIDHVDPWLTLTGLRVIHERVNG
jgi:type III pantothenate kinase